MIKTLELKKVKFIESMSEETNCYQAVVYVNGKPAIEVSNDGHGGGDMQHPLAGFDRTIIAAANEFCKKNNPATVFLHGDVTKESFKQKDILYSCLETWCGDQLHFQTLKKVAARCTKNKVSFVDINGEVYSTPLGKHTEAMVIKHFRTKYGRDIKILNELSTEEQVKALSFERTDRIKLSYEEAIKIP
jgi:hypothetical protein